MIQIDKKELFNVMMDVYMNAHKLVNPHVAGEYIIKQIEQVKNCNIADVVGQSEQLVAFLKWVGDGYDFENNAEKIVNEYLDKGN